MTNVSAASEDNMIVNLVTEVFQIATFPKEMRSTLAFMLTFVLVSTLFLAAWFPWGVLEYQRSTIPSSCASGRSLSLICGVTVACFGSQS